MDVWCSSSIHVLTCVGRCIKNHFILDVIDSDGSDYGVCLIGCTIDRYLTPHMPRTYGNLFTFILLLWLHFSHRIKKTSILIVESRVNIEFVLIRVDYAFSILMQWRRVSITRQLQHWVRMKSKYHLTHRETGKTASEKCCHSLSKNVSHINPS